MSHTQKKELLFKYKALAALLIGVLMNPILWVIIFIVDSWEGLSITRGTLVQRTPFAYIYFWADAFLPDNPDYFEASMFLALVGNMLLYSFLSYIVLSGIQGGRIKLK